uniref:Genome polyprotein n=1 Tax=Xiangshan picorna-like virus 4 TaxID=2886220 RepID=A0A8K1YQN5_9VIRU|nr:MAG: polyprotein [Xiangshan picorna-like virus 4]
MNNIKYIVLSGSGARTGYLVPRKEEEPQLVRQWQGPTWAGASQRDILRRTLLRAYGGRPFDFLFKYERFIRRYKAAFYIEIYETLAAAWKLALPAGPKKEKVRRVYPSNRYVLLKEEKSGGRTIISVPEKKQKLRFLQKDFVAAAAAKKARANQRAKELRALLRELRIKYAPKACVGRNARLLAQLREKIAVFRQQRKVRGLVPLGRVIRAKFTRRYVLARPEGDSPTIHGEGEVSVDKESNVVLTTQRPSSSTTTSYPSVRWSRWTSNDVVDDYKTITNRWYPVKEFEWTKDDAFDKQLVRITLPSQILAYAQQEQSDICNVPNTIPFKVHTYWRGDMEIKIQINSNKFQVGQLMAAFYYMDSNNAKITTKRSVYGFSQMDHVLISASASNEAILKIPYRHIYPFLPIRPVPEWDQHQLKLGQLSIHVLSPLRPGPSGPTTASGVVFCRLLNSEFTGTSSGSFFQAIRAEPEMECVLDIAEGLLALPSIRNMDNPPLQQAPHYLVPTGTHSMALGNNLVEPLHSLRLDAAGQTQHPAGCQPTEEMTVQNTIKRFGLIRQLKWSKDHHKGEKLLNIPADPFVHVAASKGHWFTPTGVVSSNFMYWRGSLEFKFDIIASPYHTGRLIVGYIPGVTSDKDVTYQQLKSSPYVVYDLQDSNSFTFTVPYVSYRPWWMRRFTGNYVDAQVVAPSSLFVFVQVPLVPMEAVTAELDINVYMRGASNFEVSIPVQPSLGLNWNTEFIKRSYEIYQALEGYYPYYAGVWHSFNSSKSLVFRRGALSDQIAQFPTPSVLKGYYTVFGLNMIKDAPKGTQDWLYMVVWPSGHGYNIGIPTLSYGKAKSLAIHLYGGGSLTDTVAMALFVPASQQGAGEYSNGNPMWTAYSYPLPKQKDNEVWDIVEPEGEEQQSTLSLNPTTSLASSGFGRSFFGESFNDLKNLLRRYQLYGQLKLSIQQDKDMDHCAFTFPCLPQGLYLDIGDANNPREVFNRCRDGPIPLISSGYRYYRGGLRFKLIFPTTTDVNVWIQHRPDRKLKGYGDAKISICGRVATGQGIYNHGYASYLQLGKVNNSIEFEVPFYNATCYNLLQLFNSEDPCDQYGVSLGEIAVGFHATDVELQALNGKPVSIFYAIADDMQFSQWVGYQPMQILDDLPAAVIKAVPEGPIPEGLGDSIRGIFSPTVEAAIEHGVKEVSKAADEKIYNLQTKIEGTVEQVLKSRNLNIERGSVLTSLISNFVHCLISPNPYTIMWALFSFLAQIGIISYQHITTLTSIGRRMFNIKKEELNGKPVMATPEVQDRINDIYEVIEAMPESVKYTKPRYEFCVSSEECRRHLLGKNKKVRFAEPEGQDHEHKDAMAIASLVYTGIATLFSMAAGRPKQMGSWAAWLMKDVGTTCRTANSIYTFVGNTFEVIEDMIHYVTGHFSGEAKLLRQLSTQPEIMKKWVQEVLFLEDPGFRMRQAHDDDYINRVFGAHAFGMILMRDLMDIEERKPIQVLTKAYDKITKLKEELIEIGSNPYIRKEPFTLCVTGPPGVGKSFATDKICIHLLKIAKIPIKSGIKCIVNPLSDYWDQCDHQPVLCVDDMWSVETGPTLEKQLNLLFQVHSPIVLSPPMAALEQKKMRYNPEIFYYNTNKPFPRFDKVEAEAVYRRRHMLIECQPSVSKKEGCPHCYAIDNKPITSLDETPTKFLQDFHHLQFRIAEEVTNPKTRWSGWYEYEDILNKIGEKFVINRRKQNQIFIEKCKEMCSLRPPGDFTGRSILDTYDAYRSEMLIKNKQAVERTITSDLSKYTNDLKLKLVKTKDAFALSWLRAKPEGDGEPQPSTSNGSLGTNFCQDMQSLQEVTDSAAESDEESIEVVKQEMTIDDVKTKEDWECYKKVMPEELRAEAIKQSGGQRDFGQRRRKPGEIRILQIGGGIESAKRTLERAYAERDLFIPTLTRWQQFDLCGKYYCNSVNMFVTLHDRECLEETDQVFEQINTAIEWFSSITESKIMFTKDREEINHLKIFEFYKQAMRLFLETLPTQAQISGRYCCHWLLKADELYSADHHLRANIGSPQYKYHLFVQDLRDPAVCNVSIPCRSASCLMNAKYFRHLFFKWWLYANPSQRLNYDCGKFTRLPGYFSDSESEKFISVDSQFKQMLIWLKSWYDKIIPPAITWIMDFIKQYWPILVMLIPSAYIAKKTGDMYKELDKAPIPQIKKWTEAQPENRDYNIVQPTARAIKVTPVVPQGSQQADAIPDIVKNNMVIITATIPKLFGKPSIVRMRCLMLRNRQMLVLRHYVEYAQRYDEGTTFSFSFAFDHSRRCKVAAGIELDFLNLPYKNYGGKIDGHSFDSNFIVMELPHSIPQFKNLIKFIASCAEHKRVNEEGMLCNDKETQLLRISFGEEVPHVIAEKGTTDIIMQGAYSYSYHGKGVCGTVLCCPKLQRPIIGIHVAGVEGHDGYGLAEPLMYEMFEDFPTSPGEPYTEVIEPKLLPVDTATIDLETIIYPYGCVPKQLAQPQSEQTCIKSTFFRGLYEVRTEPNPLSAKDSRIAPHDPLKLGVEKHGFPTKHFPSELLREAQRHLTEMLIDRVRPLKNVGKLSENDAICGIYNLDGYEPLTWNTSPGFPLRNIAPVGAKGKKWLFHLEESPQGYILNGMHAELRRLLDINADLRRRGILPPTIFTDCLKDTCLPVEKCHIPGKTRIFSISPVQYTIQFRQYFMDFMAAYRSARFAAQHAIGIDVASIEWTRLARKIGGKSGKVITGDYSNFGPGLDSEVARCAMQIVCDWILHYTSNPEPSLSTTLQIFAEELVCPLHLVKNLVYRVPSGIPSGSPITDILNSIANCLYIRVAWLSITRLPLYKFMEDVELCVYGDDLIAGVSDERIETFNTQTLGKFFANHKIRFTNADKIESEVRYTTLNEATFLKRRFLPHPSRPGILTPGLDKVSIEGVLNWYHSGTLSKVEAAKVNPIQALELAHGWGPAYYNEMRGKIRKRAASLKIDLNLPAWHELDERNYRT